MTVPLVLRRPLVVLGVVLSLVLAVATVRAAAEWTAASAPLAVKPPSIEQLQADLAAEQARSADLQARLDGLTGDSTNLVAALQAASDRIATDATQAGDLQASLKAAKAKLTALERSISKAKAATSRAAATTAPAAPAPTPKPTHGGDDD
jgi:chromosome segregation ATPase